jgi:hypothetical protein
MPSTYTLISSNVLTSSATSVIFSSIPATFTDLVFRWSPRVSSANPINGYTLRFNSDSSAIYSSRYIANANGAVDVNYDNGSTEIGNVLVNGGTSTSDTFSSVEMYIPNYTSTTSKPISYFEAVENNSASSNNLQAKAALYRNTSAITSINISGATFVTGSSFYLYGIKNS